MAKKKGLMYQIAKGIFLGLFEEPSKARKRRIRAAKKRRRWLS